MDTGIPPKRRHRWNRRRLVQETALSRRFEFETLEPRVLMSADLLPVHGALDAPGQVKQYNFNLANPTNLYFELASYSRAQSLHITELSARCSETAALHKDRDPWVLQLHQAQVSKLAHGILF